VVCCGYGRAAATDPNLPLDCFERLDTGYVHVMTTILIIILLVLLLTGGIGWSRRGR
jgi:hypothetical protein